MKNKKIVITIIETILGNFLYAFGVIAFCQNNHLVTGGTTGLGLAIHYATGINASYVVWAFDIVFFIIGFIILGKKFALTTLSSTILYPLSMRILEFFSFDFFITGEYLIATIASGVVMGIGIGLVMRAGGSTGGMDVPVLILNKYTGLPVGAGITIFDVAVLVIQLFIPGVIPEPQFLILIYGLLMIIIYSMFIDKTLLYGTRKIEIKILTKKKDEISQMILSQMDRGLTYLHSKTGYLKEETDYILTIVDLRELPKIKKEIDKIDPDAFVIISSVSEVSGKGFNKEKTYLNDKESK